MFFLIALAFLVFLQGHFNLTGVGWPPNVRILYEMEKNV